MNETGTGIEYEKNNKNVFSNFKQKVENLVKLGQSFKKEDLNDKKVHELSRRQFLKFGGGMVASIVASRLIGTQVPGVEVSQEISKNKIEELTGVDLAGVAEKNGFETRLLEENGNGPYILVIGQTHSIDDAITMGVNSERIIDTQKNIEGLVLDMQDKSTDFTNLTIEGRYDNNQKYFGPIGKFRDLLNMEGLNPENNPKVWDKLSRVYFKISKAFDNLKSYSGVEESINYLMTKKIEQVDLYLESHPEMKEKISQKDETERKLFKSIDEEFGIKSDDDSDYVNSRSQLVVLTGDIKLMLAASYGCDYSPYLMGASQKLFLDGKVKISPGTSVDEDLEALDVWNEYINLASDTNTPKEELNKIIVDVQKEVYDDREDFIIKSITNNPELNRNKFIPVIFGKKHGFLNNVRKHNELNPDKRYGLIHLTPKN